MMLGLKHKLHHLSNTWYCQGVGGSIFQSQKIVEWKRPDLGIYNSLDSGFNLSLNHSMRDKVADFANIFFSLQEP